MLVFKLMQWGGATDAPLHLRQGKAANPTAVDGTGSIDLWVNEESEKLSIYKVIFPSGEREQFIMPSGVDSIDLSNLILNYNPNDTAAQTPQSLALKADRDAGNIGVTQATAWRSALSLIVGSTVQAWNAALDATTAAFTTSQQTKLAGIEALADVTDTANVTASGALMDSEVDASLKTFALPDNTTISTFGASLVDDIDAATAQATLGLVPGANVQEWAESLDDIAGLTPTDGLFIVGNGTNWVGESGATAQVSLGIQSVFGGGGQVGNGAFSTSGGAVGFAAGTSDGGAVGFSATSTSGGAVGSFASSTSGFAGGQSAIANGPSRVQLGTGTNSTDSTIQFLASGSVTATQFGYLSTLTSAPIESNDIGSTVQPFNQNTSDLSTNPVVLTATTETLTRSYGQVVSQTASGITTSIWLTPESGDELEVINYSGGSNVINGNGVNIKSGSSTSSAIVTILNNEVFKFKYDGTNWLLRT